MRLQPENSGEQSKLTRYYKMDFDELRERGVGVSYMALRTANIFVCLFFLWCER